MKRWIRVLLIPSFLILTVTATMSAPQQQTPEAVGLSSYRLARITGLMQRYVDAEKLAGIVTMVARHGSVVFHQSTGTLDLETGAPMKPDSLFRIYSMTKPIVSVAAMSLYEEGRFQLDDPVADYLPEFADIQVLEDGNVVEPERALTIRHLLTHTSGLRYGFSRSNTIDQRYREAKILASPDLNALVERLGKIPLDVHPGERWQYGVSTDVLGALIERVSGQPLDELLDERIFRPLEMSDTGFVVPPDKIDRFGTNHRIGAKSGELEVVDSPRDGRFVGEVTLFSGGGGLVSTASDYMQFCLMMLAGGELNGARILSPKTVEFMHQNHLPPGVEFAAGGAYFGLGFAVANRPGTSEIGSIGSYSWGGAAGTIFWIDPVEDLAVVSMIQLMASPYPLREELQAQTYGALTELNHR